MDFTAFFYQLFREGGLALLKVLGPPLACAFVMQISARWAQNNLARVVGAKAFCYLTAPGVVVHELSHAMFCILFGHQIHKMKLFAPSPDGTLGFVEHRWNPHNPYQVIGNFFISTGPIWGGGALVWALLHWLGASTLPHDIRLWVPIFLAIPQHAWWWAGLYATVAVGAHVRLSSSDLRGGVGGLILLLLLWFGAYALCLGLGIGMSFWQQGVTAFSSEVQSLCMALVPVVAVNLLIAALCSLLALLRGR